jgi:1-acyl-sn-glycerol-3-phosphate acyltransferase
MKALGGVPVDRRVRQDFVEQIVERFRRAEERDEPFVLVIAPEGTRSRADRWKSGFWHIARQAGVPIALGYADYPRRRTGVGAWIEPGDDPEADMERIREFYAGKRGKRPEKQGPVRLSVSG